MVKLIFNAALNVATNIIGKIHWEWLAELTTGRYYRVTDDEQNQIRQLLTKDYYIILTRRKTHLSTHAINFSHWVLTRFKRWGYYSHSLMNLEDEVKSDSDFRLIEATNKTGVAYVPFNRVFDCDSVALLKPKTMTVDQWTAVLDNLKTHEGKRYDTIYQLADASKMSCVELVRTALMATPDYHTNFANFEALIAKSNNLDPHMFYTCGDFEVVYEVRH